MSLELNTLVKTGVLASVLQSDCATTLVVVPKSNNKVKVCGDFKVTLKTNHYPHPVIKDFLVMMSGSKFFTVLDMSTSYEQLELHPAAQVLAVNNIHKGLLNYTRVPYGLASIPSIFQAIMDDVLKGLYRLAC